MIYNRNYNSRKFLLLFGFRRLLRCLPLYEPLYLRAKWLVYSCYHSYILLEENLIFKLLKTVVKMDSLRLILSKLDIQNLNLEENLLETYTNLP